METKKEIQRIIYWWRRYKGTRVNEGKVYSFTDIDLLERRIYAYLDNPKKFKFDNPDMNIDDFGMTY